MEDPLCRLRVLSNLNGGLVQYREPRYAISKSSQHSTGKGGGNACLTPEAYEEHKVVKTLLAELAAARTANEEWQPQAKVLRENVEHHVDEEENALFDKADDALSDEEIETLGNRMEAEKARKQGLPRPTQPAFKGAKVSKVKADKPGILSRIAGLVGLGDGGSKKAVKKAPAQQKARARKGSKAGPRSASKKKAGKSTSATAGKRSSAEKGSKRSSGSRSPGAAKARNGGSSKKSAAKNRAGRK